MSYDPIRNIVLNATVKQLWVLQDFQKRYHPELPHPDTISNSLANEQMWSQWYGTIAKLYLMEVQGLPIS